jgi:ribosomal-protein-alanine N-acetyltransferase
VTPKDLAALHAAAFSDLRAWSAAEFGRLLTDRHVFLCAAPDALSGFALGRAAAGEAELLTLAVAPAHRRAGLGRSLLAAFEREAVARGAAEALMEVAVDNVAAIALYTQAGYGERGRRPDYYPRSGGRADALILGRTLS